jgi:hypothetical protein
VANRPNLRCRRCPTRRWYQPKRRRLPPRSYRIRSISSESTSPPRHPRLTPSSIPQIDFWPGPTQAPSDTRKMSRYVTAERWDFPPRRPVGGAARRIDPGAPIFRSCARP